MAIQISVSNQQKMQYLIELLKSLDFVESLTIEGETDRSEPSVTTRHRFPKNTGPVYNLVLVTRNESDFKLIPGLLIVNPFSIGSSD